MGEIQPGVDRCAGCAHAAADGVGQLLQQREIFRSLQAASAGDDDLRLGQIRGRGVEHRDQLQQLRAAPPGVLRQRFHKDRAGARRVKCRRAEHVRPHGAHLWLRVGADIGRHQIAAEGRPRPEHAAVRVHVEMRAVGRQPRVQPAGDARPEVAPHVRRADHEHFGRVFAHEAAHGGGENVRIVVRQGGIFHGDDRVGAAADRLRGERARRAGRE